MASSRLLGGSSSLRALRQHRTSVANQAAPLRPASLAQRQPNLFAMASTSSGIAKIDVQKPIVEMDGDEMTR